MRLSPRAHVKNGSYMSCETCHRYIAYKYSKKPPRFAISNGWCIGELPESIIDVEVEDIIASSVAMLGIFVNVYSYNAGAHKASKGHHTFFSNDQEHVGASFE